MKPHNAWLPRTDLKPLTVWQVRLGSDSRGTRAVQLEAQGKSNPVNMTLKGVKLRRSIRRAMVWEPFHGGPLTRVASGKNGEDVTFEVQRGLLTVGETWARFTSHEDAILPVHTPVRVRTFDEADQITNVEGTPDSEWTEEARWRNVNNSAASWYTDVYSFRASGGDHAHYQPWIQAENIVTKPARGESGRPLEDKAVFLGLAAFPLGSQVTITNTELEKMGREGHSVSKKIRGKTGSVRLEYPVATGAPLYRLEVEFPGKTNRSKTMRSVFYFVHQASGPDGAPLIFTPAPE